MLINTRGNQTVGQVNESTQPSADPQPTGCRRGMGPGAGRRAHPPARAAAPAATRHGRSVVEGLLIRLRASETQTGLPRRADCPDVCSPARRCGADAPYPLRPGDGTGVPAPRASAPPARSGTSPPFRHVPAEATPRPRTTDYGRASRCRPARPEPRQMRERARSRSTCESLLFAAQTYRLRPGPGR